MSTVSIAEFRAAFPAFTATLYPNDAVQARLDLADDFFTADIWYKPSVRKHATCLYTAHYLAAYGSKESGGSGTGAGQALGVVSSKSVDGASVSFDTSAALETNAGFWNSTPYGRELWQLMRVFGAGAIQI